MSIEDFAEQVQAYIERQPPGFRLNFFVDEVGQYIAENVKLMTNLQTIAESLATKCRGRAWVIVTAQEEMDMVVGQMSRQQSHDFSKIQARFANRMKLTSADVAVVIQKRLLLKNDAGIRQLSAIYHAEANNFKTLFDFTDGSATYRNFRDLGHFIDSYPFIPYQFALFQSAIQNLSQHNAFEGKHSSVGERSMLGVFQEVAIQICNHKLGQLATFDLMFDGIRTALKSTIQSAISKAVKHLESPFALRLLKTLFLVKYVKEFKATPRNLCVLMLESFNSNLPLLRKQVEEALNLLEQQTYIQRSGELYEYLTDEEKDVEQEIKNSEVEISDITVELEKIIFDHILKDKKIRYDENKQDYPYTRKVDDRSCGREYELTIHIISPFHANAGNEPALRMQNAGLDELLILMPADDRLMRDLTMYKKTEKYIRQNSSNAQQEVVKRILIDKISQNRERFGELQQQVKNLLSKAKLLVSGDDIEIASEDPQKRIFNAFYRLIAKAYPNLRMLRKTPYTENEIVKCLKPRQEGLLGLEISSLPEPERELLAVIKGNSSRKGIRTTLKNLLEEFERKPYGWYPVATLYTLASLYVQGKIEVHADGNPLEDKTLESALLNSRGHENVIIGPLEEFSPAQIRALKEFYNNFFNAPPHASEANALSKECSTAFQQLCRELESFSSQSSHYPFVQIISPRLTQLRELSSKPHTWYLTELSGQKEQLLEMKEKVIDPILGFMSGPQKQIYDSAQKFAQAQKANFSYVVGDEPSRLITALEDPTCFESNKMQQLKSLLKNLQEKIETQRSDEILQAKESATTLQARLCGMSEFNKLSSEQQEQILRPFTQFSDSLEHQPLIAVIRDTLRKFEESDCPRLLSQMSCWTEPTSVQKPSSLPSKKQGAESTASRLEPIVEYVQSRSLRISFDKSWLADELDVTRYLKSMREVLLEQINSGKKIYI